MSESLARRRYGIHASVNPPFTVAIKFDAFQVKWRHAALAVWCIWTVHITSHLCDSPSVTPLRAYAWNATTCLCSYCLNTSCTKLTYNMSHGSIWWVHCRLKIDKYDQDQLDLQQKKYSANERRWAWVPEVTVTESPKAESCMTSIEGFQTRTLRQGICRSHSLSF